MWPDPDLDPDRSDQHSFGSLNPDLDPEVKNEGKQTFCGSGSAYNQCGSTSLVKSCYFVAETEYKASKAFMKSDEENPSEPDYQQLKKNFGSLWITTLR